MWGNDSFFSNFDVATLLFQGIHVHNTIALGLCHEMLSDACSSLNQSSTHAALDSTYLKALMSLTVSFDVAQGQQINTLLSKILRVRTA